jgi:hypothetical protein
MAKKKTLTKKTAKKSFIFDHADFFTYEAFCVAELLAERDGITIKGMADVKDFAYLPDLYAPDGIPSLELEGPTLIDVKKML